MMATERRHHAVLKAAVADLIEMVGGRKRAEAIANVSSSQLARYIALVDERDPTQPSLSFPSIWVITQLEADLAARGSPHRPVTEAMARLSGRQVVAEPRDAVRDVQATGFALGAKVGEVLSALGATLAAGDMTPAAAARLTEPARDLVTQATRLRDAVATVAAGTEG